jgi:hypothetical protein
LAVGGKWFGWGAPAKAPRTSQTSPAKEELPGAAGAWLVRAPLRWYAAAGRFLVNPAQIAVRGGAPLAPEPRGAENELQQGRWVYEGGEKKKGKQWRRGTL